MVRTPLGDGAPQREGPRHDRHAHPGRGGSDGGPVPCRSGPAIGLPRQGACCARPRTRPLRRSGRRPSHGEHRSRRRRPPGCHLHRAARDLHQYRGPDQLAREESDRPRHCQARLDDRGRTGEHTSVATSVPVRSKTFGPRSRASRRCTGAFRRRCTSRSAAATASSSRSGSTVAQRHATRHPSRSTRWRTRASPRPTSIRYPRLLASPSCRRRTATPGPRPSQPAASQLDATATGAVETTGTAPASQPREPGEPPRRQLPAGCQRSRQRTDAPPRGEPADVGRRSTDPAIALAGRRFTRRSSSAPTPRTSPASG